MFLEIHVTFRHSSPSEALKGHIHQKIGKLSKYFIKPIQAHVTLNVEGTRHSAEISLLEDHNTFNAQESSHDMYYSVDRVIEKIERQLIKHKEKIKDHHKKIKPIALAASQD